MGYSTRCVKYKFNEGEKVLCYEPDPTKARVLYDSKVLKLETSQDERGRKVPEYKIHFSGWNNSWDRCVREEFILPLTEENRDLQRTLAREAALAIKGKKKYKLPRLIKESLAKEFGTDNENDKTTNSEHSSDSESSEGDDREVSIDIPRVLKLVLEEEWRFITEKNKIIKLPCYPNVISILEAFVKYYARNLMCASPPINSKINAQLMPDDVQNKLNLCKETVDGIRQYFDFTLPHLLLYNQEKKQYYTEGLTCSPVTQIANDESQESYEHLLLKMENESSESTSDCPIPSKKEHSTTLVKKKVPLSPTLNEELVLPKSEPNSPQASQKGRSSLRHLRPLQHNKVVSATNSSTKNKICPVKVVAKATRGRPKSVQNSKSVRILRSSRTANKAQTLSNNVSSSQAVTESKHSISLQFMRSTEKSNPPVEVRITRKAALRKLCSSGRSQSNIFTTDKASEMPNSASTSSSAQTPLISNDFKDKLHQPSSSGYHLPSAVPSLSLTSNSICSSNSSSHSTLSAPLTQNPLLFNNATRPQEILDWHMLPPDHYEKIPAAPSLIYGAHHLLRLFVKLPGLLTKVNISSRKLEPLLSILDNFLLYLSENKEDLFLSSAFVDADNDF